MSTSLYLPQGLTRVDSAMAFAVMQSMGIVTNDAGKQVRLDSGE